MKFNLSVFICVFAICFSLLWTIAWIPAIPIFLFLKVFFGSVTYMKTYAIVNLIVSLLVGYFITEDM